LLDAVVQERLIPLIDEVWAGFGSVLAGGAPLVAAMETLIDNLLRATEKLPSLPALWLNEIMAESGQFKSRVLPYVFARYLAEFRKAFAEAEAKKEIAEGMNPRLIILSILGSTLLPLSVAAIAAEGDDMPSREQIARHAKRLLIPGLLGERHGEKNEARPLNGGHSRGEAL
jgi:AcrR family transcriptional regulator